MTMSFARRQKARPKKVCSHIRESGQRGRSTTAVRGSWHGMPGGEINCRRLSPARRCQADHLHKPNESRRGNARLVNAMCSCCV